MNFPIHMDQLGALVARLRSEGFDARADLFNGQVGLIVGPNGLDPKRMPPETAGLFFPLWELNYNPNRALVDARRFHEVFESRPSGWKFNRPYQQSEEHERLNLRHWNRSAALLGDKAIEESIQREASSGEFVGDWRSAQFDCDLPLKAERCNSSAPHRPRRNGRKSIRAGYSDGEERPAESLRQSSQG